MHHDGLHGLARSVADVNLLLRTLATIHVIKLNVVAVCLDIAKHKVVLATEVYNLRHHITAHSQHKRLVAVVRIDVDELVEVAHCLSVILHAQRELSVRRNVTRGIFHIRASAACTHVHNARGTSTLVGNLKLSRYGRTEHHLSAVHNLIGCCYFLCVHPQRRHCEENGGYI